MAKLTVQLMDTDMSAWAPGTRHYRTSNGQDFAVEAPIDPIPAGAVQMINDVMTAVGADELNTVVALRPTVIFRCNSDGSPIDLTPLAEFDCGTIHAEALRKFGFDPQ
jgi:hypothetical protein